MNRTYAWSVPAAAAGLALLTWQTDRLTVELQDTGALTGWSLLLVMLFLGLFNVRKRLSMVPLGTAATWLKLHVVLGVTLAPLFWLHTRSIWPGGLYEQLIAALFYLAFVSGLAGYVLSRVVPRRIDLIDGELILERIPAEVARVREAAREAVRAGVEASGHETLARQYEEALGWFFARPRFAASHVTGAARPKAWVEQRTRAIRDYLGSEEQDAFNALVELMHYKNRVDAHYANQRLLRLWLLVHLPLSVALIILGLWHALLVHVYVY